MTAPNASNPSLDPAETKRLAKQAARLIVDAFGSYMSEFKALTQEARRWFEQREWATGQRESIRRLDMYSKNVRETKAKLQGVLQKELTTRDVWVAMKSEYSHLIEHRADEELAETYFNSVTRAMLTTMGVDRDVEFVWFDIEILPSGDELPTYGTFHRLDTTGAVIADVLKAYAFDVPWMNEGACAERVAERVDGYLCKQWGHSKFDALEIATPVFYRNKGAYIVGRIRRGLRAVPFVLALSSEEEGIRVDAVLMDEELVSMVFSFARSYFLVDPVRPVELIGFLRSLMPVKPVAELYIALGYVKHGKTVRYRDFFRQLGHTTDRFQFARGTKGMVMICFTLPSYGIVFKLIRDKFEFPKKSSRAEVKASYDLIFKHNRVGRLIDAQEFEHIRFDKSRFEENLLEELANEAKQCVTITDDEVIFHHVYTERRLNPLNIYVREVGHEKAMAAVVEYGNAIKDLAAANVFPGDLLIKNFGVTRHGRVVFYDYDEVCLLSACRFRRLPAQHESEEGEISFFVDDNDIFPEEFRSFLWPAGPLREAFEVAHPELFTVEFWRDLQARTAEGEVLDIFPYPQRIRLTR